MHAFPRLLSALSFSLCLALSSPLFAQNILVPKVIFTGAPEYAPADLLAVAGLKPGSVVPPSEIQSAAVRLNDTGLFNDIRFGSTSQGLVFTLKPMPREAVLPATYTNLVWWKPAELQALLEARVPLFLGSVPTSGNLQNAIAAALTTLVKEKGIADPHIAAIPLAKPGSPPSSIAFSLDSPSVLIGTLSIQHTDASVEHPLSELSSHQVGAAWEQGASPTAISSSIEEIYRDHGFLDAAVTSLTPGQPVISPDHITVNPTAVVSEGEPYRISSITWPGSPMMSAEDFNKTLKLHPGDIASQSALRSSLRPLANALFSHGYQDAKVQAPATLDRATHHVSYTVSVIPGDQYRIHTVRTLGLSDVQQKEFDSAWRLHPGDPYDTVYVSTFLQKNTALRSLAGHSASYKAISDPDTHLVDLTITFVKGGSLVTQ